MNATTHPPGRLQRNGPAKLLHALAVLATTVIAATSLVVIMGTSPASALSGDTRMHDTTAIRVDDCTWIYSTGFENDPDNPTGAVTMHRSCDGDQVTGWTDMGPIWDVVPAWITSAFNGVTPPNYWAPDINYFNGRYYLYYAASLWSNNKVASMGLATSDSPGGPWVDQGEVTDLNYPIDVNVAWSDSEAPYVSWGSWAGTYLHALDPQTGKLSTTDDDLWKIATNIENGTILAHDGYYYLIGSRGSCCSGTNSTYYTVVGRSTSITGPYLDKTGRDMAAGGGSTILTGFGTQVAAGGGDWYEAEGSLWFAYHYYDAENAGRETGNIRPITFTGGWPVMGTPVGSIANQTVPTISGRPHVGVTLTASPGQWNVDGDLSYQWHRDGIALTGATGQTYVPVPEDLGHELSVRVTASKPGYDGSSATSAAVRVFEQPALEDGLRQAEATELTPYTLGSAELFIREVAAIKSASAEPKADAQALSNRLEDAYSILISTDTLLIKQPISRSWVTASTPIFGNAGSAADNGWALFDGDVNTFVSGATANGSVSVTPTDGSTISIDRIRVFPRGENLEGRLIGHKFQGSNDAGTTWETFATLGSAKAGEWTVVDLPEGKEYQRIRMVDDHGGWINAGEAEILARGTDSTLVDVLLADAAAIERDAYEASSIARLDAAVTAAQGLSEATQIQINEVADSLRTALEDLLPSGGFATVSGHIDRAESTGQLTSATASKVRAQVEQAEHLASSPAARRSVAAHLDNAMRTAESSADLVDALKALADSFR